MDIVAEEEKKAAEHLTLPAFALDAEPEVEIWRLEFTE